MSDFSQEGNEREGSNLAQLDFSWLELLRAADRSFGIGFAQYSSSNTSLLQSLFHELRS
jgi:hypothetical protein